VNICSKANTRSKASKGLYNIRQLRKFISTEATKILVHDFVTSHLDYCKSLLSGVPQYQLNHLQKILNAAGRLVCLVPKFDHITPYLIDLHWLPAEFRIKFKVLIFVFKALNGMAPRYISDLIRKKSSPRSALRSNDLMLLVMPRTKCKTLGDRAFAYAGPSMWNKLPKPIQMASNIYSFQKTAKNIFVQRSLYHSVINFITFIYFFLFVMLLFMF